MLHITINILDFPLSFLEQEHKSGILKNKEALLRNLFKVQVMHEWRKIRRGGAIFAIEACGAPLEEFVPSCMEKNID